MGTDTRSFTDDECVPEIVFTNVLSQSKKQVKTQCKKKPFHYFLINEGEILQLKQRNRISISIHGDDYAKVGEMSRKDTEESHWKCQ